MKYESVSWKIVDVDTEILFNESVFALIEFHCLNLTLEHMLWTTTLKPTSATTTFVNFMLDISMIDAKPVFTNGMTIYWQLGLYFCSD
jgi:hypothetical protein